MSEPARKKKNPSMTIPDWTLLPGELLHVISTKLHNCFDVLHARSVCTSWRSSFPFPEHRLTRPTHSLPSFAEFPYESDDFCTLEKVPIFLFRAKTRPILPSLYFIGGVIKDEQNSSQTQSCSLKVKVHERVLDVANILDFQIFPLGHHYRVIGFDPREPTSAYRGVAVIPGKGDDDYLLLLNYTKLLYIFRSAEMKWIGIEEFSDDTFYEVVAFRGMFYASFVTAGVFVLDPYLMEVTPLMPSPPLQHAININNLVKCGDDDDELFLVEKFYPFPDPTIIDFGLFNCRVSRLDEKAGKWVAVSDLGGRVLFIGHFGNVCCLGKELPDGCGLSGNSIVYTSERGRVTFAYKYTRGEGDGLGIWRLSREFRVSILSTSPVVALRVERPPVTPTLAT
ncbi:unnamed protein product [Eruca vesicaria subsp. sativa]|uniref:KIB1-4 beta-propeller domain-containing protein n=1 Tax=Eruca vesicaria subsp. sativa TaxID=29727 RepID=A0ABC8L6D3_ERUVS|nr:unnamed protein product [Eruca vesicaria subsp. sativa]